MVRTEAKIEGMVRNVKEISTRGYRETKDGTKTLESEMTEIKVSDADKAYEVVIRCPKGSIKMDPKESVVVTIKSEQTKLA